MTEKDDFQKEVDEVVEEMKQKIDSITKEADDIKDEDFAKKAEEIKEKVVSVLKNVTEKVTASAKQVRDSKEFEEVMSFVKTKSKELYDNAHKKLSELKESETVKANLNKAQDTYNDIKTNVDSFFDEIEASEKIEKAKAKTIDVAERAVAGLRKWLLPDDENGEKR